MARSRRSRRSGKKPDIKTDGASITIGVEKAGIGASVTVGFGTLEIGLGVGVAAVNYDLIEPYNSSVSYAFDLYEIEGERRGCEVVLSYKIAGTTVKTETRQIPECDEDKDEDEKKREEEGENADDLGPEGEEWSEDDFPPGCWVYWIYGGRETSHYKVVPGLFGWEHYELQNVTESGVYFSYNLPADYGDFRGFFMKLSGPESTVTNEEYGTQLLINAERTLNGGPRNKSPEMGDTFTISYGQYELLSSTINYFVEFLNGRWQYYEFETAPDVVAVKFVKSAPPRAWCRNIESSGFEWQNRRIGRGGKYPPPKENMDEKCCKLIKRMYKALAVDEVLDKKMKVPARWTVPNGKGYVELDNYLSILNYQMRMADHLGIHPFKALVTDVNAAKKGNQSAAVQTINATSATRQIMELLLENKGDSATRLNLQVRIAVAVGQILNAVSIAAKSIEQVSRFIGMPRKEKKFKVQMPFDFTFGQGNKGFGKGKGANPSSSAQDKLDSNTEKATEELLPKFMQEKEQPIIVEMYDDNDLTLLEAIQRMNQ